MQSIHILIVSLSSAFLHAATQMLHRDARIVEIREVRTGQEAVEQVKEWQPDVVLIDMWLSDMSGVEAVRKMRTQSCVSRIVLMTLEGVRPDRDAASKLGLDEVIDKTHFSEAVKSLLATIP